jgi:hypothetical protein
MSYIANTLNELLVASKLTAAELARSGAANAAQISRIRSGAQVWVAPEDLRRLAEVFAKRIGGEHFQTIHARLLYARLHDECVGPGATHIAIELRSEDGHPALKVASPSPKPVLPPKIQQNLDVIANHITANRHVRDLIENIATFCRSSLLPQGR